MARYITRRLRLFPVALWGVIVLVSGAFMLLSPQQRVATRIRAPGTVDKAPAACYSGTGENALPSSGH